MATLSHVVRYEINFSMKYAASCCGIAGEFRWLPALIKNPAWQVPKGEGSRAHNKNKLFTKNIRALKHAKLVWYGRYNLQV